MSGYEGLLKSNCQSAEKKKYREQPQLRSRTAENTHRKHERDCKRPMQPQTERMQNKHCKSASATMDAIFACLVMRSNPLESFLRSAQRLDCSCDLSVSGLLFVAKLFRCPLFCNAERLLHCRLSSTYPRLRINTSAYLSAMVVLCNTSAFLQLIEQNL